MVAYSLTFVNGAKYGSDIYAEAQIRECKKGVSRGVKSATRHPQFLSIERGTR